MVVTRAIFVKDRAEFFLRSFTSAIKLLGIPFYLPVFLAARIPFSAIVFKDRNMWLNKSNNKVTKVIDQSVCALPIDFSHH
jgi:hypothetical protein